MEENTQHFQHIMHYYFKKGKRQLKRIQRFVQYTEKVCDWSDRVSSGISHWTRWRLIAIKWRHSWKPVKVLPRGGDGQHIQNSQINQFKMVKMKNRSFTENTIRTFWPTQYILFASRAHSSFPSSKGYDKPLHWGTAMPWRSPGRNKPPPNQRPRFPSFS